MREKTIKLSDLDKLIQEGKLPESIQEELSDNKGEDEE